MTEHFADSALTFMENWNARHMARYAEAVERGEHDHDCEQRERSSLCHCSKRKRERDGKTDLPELWFHAPTCGGCHEEVEFDGDGFDCPRCHVSWDRHATDGDKADRFNDDHGPETFGGERFGERLLALVTRPGLTPCPPVVTRPAAPCPNDHGADGVIACWSPGGPCPTGQTVCETCGPCTECRPGEHPAIRPAVEGGDQRG